MSGSRFIDRRLGVDLHLDAALFFLVLVFLLGLGICSALGEARKTPACIIDIDGTVADETRRRETATDAKGSLDWQQYFLPDRIAWDQPIPGAKQVLDEFVHRGISIIYLSSREDTLQQATENWLKEHGFPSGQVLLRPRYGKTLEFKVERVSALRSRFDILFGIGDRESDKSAYEMAGVRALLLDSPTREGWERVLAALAGVLPPTPEDGDAAARVEGGETTEQ
ncbi:hypothetical protein JW905_04370 [bacterium]|nr:hypothetical protein [candidate division CSSED10-310 bacterium]